nr:uncharacterized protein LOC127307914 isoform X3 [Lolium perenne]
MAAARVPDEARRWWETFSNGAAVDEGEEEGEPDADSDSSFEQEEDDEGQNADAVASESDRKMASVRVARESTNGHSDVLQMGCCRDAEEEVSGDCYAQLQGGLLGSKRKAIATHAEPQITRTGIQDEKVHKEYIAQDNFVHIGGGLQGGKMEATVTLDKLQPTTGTEIHDKKCYHQKVKEENAGVTASESGGKMMADAQAPVEEPSRGGTASHHCNEEEVSEDAYVQLQGDLLGTKRKAVTTHAELQSTRTEIQDKQDRDEYIGEDKCVHIGGRLQGMKWEATATPSKLQRTIGTEIYDKNAQGECLRAENEMPNELEAQQIRRLELELNLKTREIKSLKKQNEELRIENEYYRKTAKPPKNPRLCRFCNLYVFGHEYKNCPGRLASASSEQDGGDDSH